MSAVPDNEQTRSRCICADCPSFPSDGGLYCAKGKSSSRVTRRGCTCGDCENYKELSLTKDYFCAEGAATDD